MIKIRIINTLKSGDIKELDLKPETMLNNECLIGRYETCDLRLEADDTVSRLHGKILFRDNKYYFADLASKGGSWINAQSVKVKEEYLLNQNDAIRIGAYLLIVVEIGSASTGEGITEIDIVTQHVTTPQKKTPPVKLPSPPLEPEKLTWWTKGELQVRCVQVIKETDDVKTYRFVADPPVLFSYKPGQFVTLDLEINGEQVLSSYSISSTPSRPHSLEITVKLPPPTDATGTSKGLVSNWLHDNLRVGNQIKISEPMGKFTCVANPAQKLLLISAGSGITPIMSMSRWLCDIGSDIDIIFFHCARTPRDIIFRSELELMSARYPNFHLAVSTTRREPGYSWLSMTGRLDTSMLQLIAPDFLERTAYVCGPHLFMSGTKQMLESLRFPMQNYYEESLGQAPESSTPNKQPGLKGMMDGLFEYTPSDRFPGSAVEEERSKPTKPITASSKNIVFFAKSGQEFPCDREQTILNLAEKNAVKVPAGCRIGACGACKKVKKEGEIKYHSEPQALNEGLKQEGYILTCISSPVGRVVIDA
jgi:glycine betaine catabolism B